MSRQDSGSRKEILRLSLYESLMVLIAFGQLLIGLAKFLKK